MRTTVHAMFEARADDAPLAWALRVRDERLTYGEVDCRANQLAWLLREHGVGPDGLVAVHLPRGSTMVELLLGILKAGGGYLALDPEHPRARLRRILADAAPTVVITSVALRDGLGACDQPVLLVESLVAERNLRPSHRPDIALDPRNLAYVAYTSGSTGEPKGVMVTHAAVANLLGGRQPIAVRPDDVVVFHSPLAFDASTLELWGTLTRGAEMLIAPPDPLTIADYRSCARDASFLVLTSALFNLLVDEGCAELATLRQLLVGGETVDPHHVARAPIADVSVLNCYGPTECTTLSTTGPARAVAAASGRVPIGRPLAGMDAFVLDSRLRAVPPGEEGELYLGGAGLARGYLGRPGQTAHRFVPHPYARRPGERLYRTGDMARWLDDGALEFLGRRDDQVKVRGFRIEPAEVEAALLTCDGVRAAVVVGREDTPGERRLIGYVSMDGAPDGGRLAPAVEHRVRAQLRDRVPDHMVPALLVGLATVPLTPQRKVDRRRLPAPPRPEARASDDATTTAQKLLIGVWQEILGVDQVGLDDDFFTLGGTSLQALRLVEELDAHGARLTARELLRATTVRDLAARLEKTLQET